MTVAVVFGDKGRSLRDNLLRVQDNLTIDAFATVGDLISTSKSRSYFYNRILILSNVIRNSGEDKTIQSLLKYWRGYCQSSSIVVMCSASKDVDLATKFTKTFSSPLCTAMLVSSTTINVIVEAASGKVATISEKYGVHLDSTVEVDNEVRIVGEKPSTQEDTVTDKPEPVQHQNIPPSKDKTKSKGFLGGLFGRNKGKVTADSVATSQVSPVPDVQANFNSTQFGTQVDSNVPSSPDFTTQPDITRMNSNPTQPVNLTAESGVLSNEPDSSNVKQSDENSELNSGVLSSLDESQLTSENSNQSMTSSVCLDASTDTESSEQGVLESNIAESGSAGLEGVELDIDVTDTLESCSLSSDQIEGVDDVSAPTSNENGYSGQSDFSMGVMPNTAESDITEVEEPSAIEESSVVQEPVIEQQVEQQIVTSEQNTPENTAVTQREVVSEIPENRGYDFSQGNIVVEDDDDFGDMALGDLEGNYRERAEPTVKIIEKQVIKEVVREVNVSGNAASVYSSILKGRTKKIILVTGDRGSGVTSLAYDLASFFSKYVKTLYFDGDTTTHGLLSYIEYDQFCNYDTQQLKGVKLCKSSKAFSNCVMRFDSNLDILSTNYGVDVTDDELEITQSVVCEVSDNYGVVVVDAPVDRLSLFQDLVLAGNVILTVEANKRGVMNMICKMEDSTLPLRYKRSIAGKGTLVYTKVNPKINMNKLKQYVEGIVEFEDVNWLSMTSVMRDGKLTQKFIEDILEG